MNNRYAFTALAFVGLGAVALMLLTFRPPAGVSADETPDVLRLSLTVRDFRQAHADFDIGSVSEMGHCAGNVATTLADDRRPVYDGDGERVSEQWFDKDGNPIMPYLPPADDAGLPGGHFDVDVFDEATDKELYHKHEFDDAYDVDYIDVANDPKLLFDDIIPATYPNDLRVEFFNAHHGVGEYVFQAGGPPQTGRAEDGFTAEFRPSTLAQLRVTFTSLNDLRHTKPGDVQNDVADRDGAFAVRMYDTISGELVYEIAAYHHGEAADIEHGELGGTFEGEDSCGASIVDDIGDFAGSCPGTVTSGGTFDQWFRDVLGTNLSGAHVIELHRNVEGVYEHFSDDFFPADDRLFGNEGRPHNNFFTIGFNATFVHDACAGLFFEFEGNDDAWVFIDGELVIDLGGLATPERQYIALDRLGLQDGETHTLTFFYAHRRDALHSIFNIRTNIDLHTSGSAVTASYD